MFIDLDLIDCVCDIANCVTVFDVTDAKFYGKGANYHVFAGTDFTVCLIKSSLDKAMTNIMDVANHGIADSAIESKINFYKGKYQRVGTLKEWVDVHGSKFIYE